MALRRRGFVSVGAVVACCALAVACTPEQPASAPSPTPASTTPTESQIERQMRLDYEAAEKAYRANMAEQDRLYQAGGMLRSNCRRSGQRQPASYLGLALELLRDIKKSGWRATGDTPRSVALRRKWGWQENRVQTDELRR